MNSDEYRNNPALRAAILDQLQDPGRGNKQERPRSVIVGARGQPLDRAIETSGAEAVPLPPPGAQGDEAIPARQEMLMACRWLMSLSEEDAAQALVVIRAMKEGWTP